MTPAKPQQMSGQTDDADDLIAELAKLMATDAKGSDIAPSSRLDSAPEPRPANQPPIRIPGMGQPTGAPPAAANKFDFGRPPAPAPVPPPEPLANWQERAAPRPAMPQAAVARQEPFVAAPVPTSAPSPVSPVAAEEAGRGFDFDFGFNAERPTPTAQAPVAAPVEPAPTASILSSGHDPIADLIAAELDAAGSLRTTVSPPVAAPAPAPIVAPRQMTVPVEPRPQPQPEPVLEAPSAPVQLRALPPIPAPAAASQAAPRMQPSAPALRPVNLTARPLPSENDRFATAPVFGLGGRPSSEPAAPKAAPDPMDEIENLIGEAVRVELSAPQQLQPVKPVQAPAARVVAPVQQQTSSSPAVPPLTTQFAPRRTSLRDAEPTSRGAEDAILAAAAATGAEVGHFDTPQAEERAFKPKKQARRERPALEDRPSGGAFKQLIVPAVAGTLLLAAGFGLYWVLGMTHHDGQAPVLAADATPAKQIPPKTVAPDATHSVVLDQLGGKPAATGTEQLVSRDQTAGADAAQVAAPPATATANNDTGIANRKVRTVTVRPDGTIVSGDDAVAGAAKLPVDRPNVPAVPGAAAASTTDGTTPTAADASAVPALPALTPAPADTSTAATTAVADNSANQPASDAPVPMPRPVSRDQTFAIAQPTSPVNALVRSTTPNKPVDLIGNLAANADAPVAPVPAQPAAPAQAPAPAVAADTAAPDNADVTSAPAHAQLASQRSQADAQASANSLQRKFGAALNNAKLQVVKVDLGAKGIYYRVIMPTSSLQSAQQVCAAIKAGGGDCVALNG